MQDTLFTMTGKNETVHSLRGFRYFYDFFHYSAQRGDVFVYFVNNYTPLPTIFSTY